MQERPQIYEQIRELTARITARASGPGEGLWTPGDRPRSGHGVPACDGDRSGL